MNQTSDIHFSGNDPTSEWLAEVGAYVSLPAARAPRSPAIEDGLQQDVPTALYRLYDVDSRLLYVGIADTPDVRWAQHAKDKHWWGDVAERFVHWMPNREAALEAERRAIQREAPLHNVVHATQLRSHTWAVASNEIDHDPVVDRTPKTMSVTRQIIELLRAEIVEMSPGDRLSSSIQIAAHLGVTRNIAANAIAVLKEEGLVCSRARRYFVA